MGNFETLRSIHKFKPHGSAENPHIDYGLETYDSNASYIRENHHQTGSGTALE